MQAPASGASNFTDALRSTTNCFTSLGLNVLICEVGKQSISSKGSRDSERFGMGDGWPSLSVRQMSAPFLVLAGLPKALAEVSHTGSWMLALGPRGGYGNLHWGCAWLSTPTMQP